MLSWVEIDSKALLFNIKNFRKIINKKTQFYAVVKSNAYGHGIRQISKIIQNEIDGFAVNHILEINEIYDLVDKPILVMGGYEESDLKNLLDKDYQRIMLVLSNLDQLNMLKNILKKDVLFFIKVDTGMSRLGYRADSKEFHQLLESLKDHQHQILGLMTHFANVEDVTEQFYAYQQLQRFEDAKRILYQYFPKRRRFFKFHSASSAATMLIPKSHQNLVRIGISLYGLWPSLPTKLSVYNVYKDSFLIKPVLKWKTRIVHINEVPPDSKVGYGCSYHTSNKTKIAVLPVGYNEGYDRSLSNRSSVIVRDKRAMVIGRVCMNMIMVDVTHIPNVQVGDEVILIGRSTKTNEEVSADDLAEWANTINYEIVTRIHPSIPRIIQ